MTSALSIPLDDDAFVPALRSDALRVVVDGETIVWSAHHETPVVLDPVARVMIDVIDGSASIAELAQEVHEEVGVSYDVARSQVARVVDTLQSVGMLQSSPGQVRVDEIIASRPHFAGPATHCAETASRAKGVSNLGVRVGDVQLRIASNSRRAIRLLRRALPDRLPADAGELAFLLHLSPIGHHSLSDRTGIQLSEGRGVASALGVLAAHLTGFLPPMRGCVRVLGRIVVSDERAVLGAFPVFTVPTLDDSAAARLGYSIIDRQMVDVEVASGRIQHTPVPWPKLADFDVGAGHVGTGGSLAVTHVAIPAGGARSVSRAAAATALASTGRAGSPAAILEACTRLVSRATVVGVSLETADAALTQIE